MPKGDNGWLFRALTRNRSPIKHLRSQCVAQCRFKSLRCHFIFCRLDSSVHCIPDIWPCRLGESIPSPRVQVQGYIVRRCGVAPMRWARTLSCQIRRYMMIAPPTYGLLTLQSTTGYLLVTRVKVFVNLGSHTPL